MILRSIPADARRGVRKHSLGAIIFAAAIWAKCAARNIWLGVREWCGDCAYERYLQAQPTSPDAAAPLTSAEFYLEQLNRRYSRPNRCC